MENEGLKMHKKNRRIIGREWAFSDKFWFQTDFNPLTIHGDYH